MALKNEEENEKETEGEKLRTKLADIRYVLKKYGRAHPEETLDCIHKLVFGNKKEG